MKLANTLGIEPGITAVIGSGGKTTLMYTLAGELRAAGNLVIVTTSTHIMRPDDIRTVTGDDIDLVRQILDTDGIVCVGSIAQANEGDSVCAGASSHAGKLTTPVIPFDTLAAMADVVIVEADGSKRKPLKAHADYEPVIPAGTNRTILIAGLSGIGKKCGEVCHRADHFAALAGITPEDIVSETALANVIQKEALGDLLLLNQADTQEDRAKAETIAKQLQLPVFSASLHKGEITCLS